MYEAKRWREDSRFQAPMAISSKCHVFVGDFVSFFTGDTDGLGKIKKFYVKVCYVS